MKCGTGKVGTGMSRSRYWRMLISRWCGHRPSGKHPKKDAPQKRADGSERAGNPASAVVPRLAENGGTVLDPGLVRVAAPTPSEGAVLPLPAPQPVRLN